MIETSETTVTARDVLNRAFRPGSSAQRVAALLLDGDPHSRDSLASEIGVSPSTVPRVVNKLRSEGIPVDATVGKDGRSSVFQVTSAALTATGRAVEAGSSAVSELSFHGDVVEVVAHGRAYSFTFHADGTLAVRSGGQEIRLGLGEDGRGHRS